MMLKFNDLYVTVQEFAAIPVRFGCNSKQSQAASHILHKRDELPGRPEGRLSQQLACIQDGRCHH